VRIRVLGEFAVDGLPERELGSRKARLLLKVLALARGAPVSVDRLADILWADELPTRPADQVGVLVSRLRRVVGGDRLTRSEGGYRLAADWLDVDEVATLAVRAAEAWVDGRVTAARTAADAALSLVRGPLLPEETGEWVAAERASAEAVIARARAVALDAALAAGDHGAAASLAESALGHDPYDEVALRALMRAHLGAGRPASALAAYARVRHSLAEDLGVPPTAETEVLHGVALAAADGDAPVAARPGGAGPEASVGGGTPAAGRAFGTALVGRAQELSTLDGALADAADGATPLVVVSGEPGIGKTTLVEHWAARAAQRGAVILRGRCDELGRDLPLQPVADAVADHLRSVGAERAAAIVGSDEDILAALLGPVVGSAATVVPDVEMSQVALFSALARVLTRAADGGPVVLVVEDLHQAGPSTVGWLAFVRHRCPGAMLVVTTRSRDRGPLADGLTVRLGTLTVEDVADLAGPEQAAELHERSGGHPLLLAALVVLIGRPGDGGELPASVRDAVGLRVDALGGEVAATLRVAAVLGVDCDVDLVAEVRRLPTVEVLDQLEAASQAGLVVERGATFAFGHDLVRDALADAAGAARRALVHRDAARVLAARPRPDVLAVAVHARQGGDLSLAASAYIDAAEAAAARFDVAVAEDYLEQALALDATPRAYTVRARVRMSRLALDDAAGDAARALSQGGGAVASEVAGWVAYYQRHYDAARAHAERALEQADDPALKASALALAGRVRHGAGDLQGALDCLTTAVPGAPAAVSGVAAVWLGQVRNHQGRPLDALETLDRAAALGDALAHPWAPLHLRWNRAIALGQLAHVADGLAAVTDLERAIERSGPVGARFRGPAANIAGWLLRWSGRVEEADERNRAAVEVSGGPGGTAPDRMPEAWYVGLLDLADGCLQRGDPAAAAGYVARLDGLLRSTVTMAWHQRHRLGLLRARLALAGGDQAGAALLAAEVAGDAAARAAGRYELLATAVLGLADPAVPLSRLETVVEGLGRCAVLDGWPLVAALAAARGVDRWQREAGSMVARVVAASGGHAEAARRVAARVLEKVSAAPLEG
jgi:DNA-binding SARP family transcriptional activator